MEEQKNTTDYIGCYSLPDGYFGKRSIQHILFDRTSGHVLHIYRYGMYVSPYIGPCVDSEEVRWLIENHPNGQKYFKNWKTGR